jgi:hypothetical protein
LNISLFDVWVIAGPLAVMAGVFILIFTVPVMMLKQISGDLRH